MRSTRLTATITCTTLAAWLQGCPGGNGCPSCQQSLREAISAGLSQTHDGIVKANTTYYVDLYPEDGSGDLEVSGPIENLQCTREEKKTRCTFTATEEGAAHFEVKAGKQGLKYTLNVDALD